eukprot:CAMPEP_0174945142 /NCGR_PEP_ID=MMETSP1355-20121228/80811_1 /TAXON_ID=464990 /ORGANISM="Hemiselmis tepida, Strain CCMP443" /LENGTH=61 /DNA_ID=CAMNT_0016192499 /DNA_START=41 /DNA_END=223 /DNA_ORIENTATION=-
MSSCGTAKGGDPAWKGSTAGLDRPSLVCARLRLRGATCLAAVRAIASMGARRGGLSGGSPV